MKEGPAEGVELIVSRRPQSAMDRVERSLGRHRKELCAS